MNIKQTLKSYFSMSKGEQRGSIALACLIFIVAIFPRVFTTIQAKMMKPDFEKIATINQKIAFDAKTETNLHVTSDTLFAFDPNTISYNSLLQLGIPSKLALSLIKYRDAGGKFRTKFDMQRLYGMTDSIFNRISPYIQIVEKYQTKTDTKKKHHTENKQNNHIDSSLIKQFIVELNTADSLQLVAMQGIGPITAHRILAYRRLLGGFYTVEQLREVHNFPEDTYVKLYPHFIADTSKIKKINLNNFKYAELKRHPYISIAQLNSITNYKKVMGKFKSTHDLLKYHLVDTTNYERILPYLKVE